MATQSDIPRWRVGRSVGRTVYIQNGDDPSKQDQLIGVMDSRALAALVVDAVNAVNSASRAAAPPPPVEF